jgi:uncharacterized protein YegL
MKTVKPSLQRVGTFCGALSRPVSIRHEQLAILVRDSSSSMNGEKAVEADAASRALAAELAAPANRGAFTISVIDFSSTARLVHPPEAADALVARLAPISAGGSTNIADALGEAARVVRSAPKPLVALRPVVLLFSDGRPNSGGDARAVARDLKAVADVVTVAFGSDADEAFLRDVASSPAHAYRCRDGRDLRNFFTSVGSTMSRSIAAGVSVTGPLGTLNQGGCCL